MSPLKSSKFKSDSTSRPPTIIGTGTRKITLKTASKSTTRTRLSWWIIGISGVLGLAILIFVVVWVFQMVVGILLISGVLGFFSN